MSENQNRGINDFSKYDSMATDELEEILRLDAEAPEGQALDEELLFYVMGVLEERKKNSDNPGKTAQQAWESFQKHYLPQEEEPHIAPIKKTGKSTGSHLRRWIVAAAVLAILVGIPLTSSALHWDEIWNIVAKWAQDTFSFVQVGETTPTAPAKQDDRPYDSLQQLLAEADKDATIVPTWIPDGYELKDIRIDENPMQKSYLAFYSNGEKDFNISIKSYVEIDPEKIEINEDVLDIYTVSGINHYFFSNNQQNRVMWVKDSYECNISGDLTIEEIKMMIDSIGKG